MEVVSRQGALKELPGGTVLLSAGVENRPDACVPLSAHWRPAALGDAAVDYRSADASFGGVVGRRNGRVEEEPEDGIAVLDEPFGQCRRLRAFAARMQLRQPKNAVFNPEHDAVKAILGDSLTHMPAMKQAFEVGQEALSKFLVRFGWQRGEEFDVPNQMCQAELLEAIAVLDVGAEKVADDGAVISLSKDLFQDPGTSRLGDTKGNRSGPLGPLMSA